MTLTTRTDTTHDRDLLLANTPPNDRASETALLGGVFLDHSMLERAREHVTADDFYDQKNRWVFVAMERIAARGDPIDLNSVVLELRAMGTLEAAGGVLHVANYMSATPSSANVPYYARVVRSASEARMAVIALANAQRLLFSSEGTYAERLERATRLVHLRLPAPVRGREEREPEIVWMSEVEAKPVSWLWFPYLPLGKVSILEGDPSAGKTYMALSLAAKLSRGQALPGVSEADPSPRATLYLTAEDGLEDTIRPRLDVLDADASAVGMLKAWSTKRGKKGTVTLKDVDVLEAACSKARPALVVVDPIQSFLGSDVDMNRANEVRPITEELGNLAARWNCSVLLIRHFSKGSPSKTAYRGMGSIDFTGQARSVMQAGKVEDGTKALVHSKTNLGPVGDSLTYSIDAHGFHWGERSEATASDLAAVEGGAGQSGKAVSEAVEFLRTVLANGPIEAKALANEASELGISRNTLDRARQKLGVLSERVNRDGGKGVGRWFASLPKEVQH